MKFYKTEIPDLTILEPIVFEDDRGNFYEAYKEEKFNNYLGYKINFCQDNEAKSSFGVLRGLHYQQPPYSQSKLVRVNQGSILDVAVDIRKGSRTFGKHFAIELNDKNKKQLFIPHGFAHGYIVLSESAVVTYKVDNYYNKESERGLAYNDPMLKIDWKVNIQDIQVSKKDLKQPFFENIFKKNNL
jgi:dTDP-4-dehydrorhamnose 3,5-epimerase